MYARTGEIAAKAFPIAALAMAGLLALGGDQVFSKGLSGTLTLYGTATVLLLGGVLASIHHAETLKHATGEPLGTLIVTLAITVIEVSLIAQAMLDGKDNTTLARDTVYSVIMVVSTGLVGLCLLLGGLRYREQAFSEQGANAYLSVLMVLSVVTLILPNTTVAAPGPTFTQTQLVFVAAVTLALYGIFLYVQTVHHPDFFIEDGNASDGTSVVEAAAKVASKGKPKPNSLDLTVSAVLLGIGLLGVVLLAKKITGVLAKALAAAGAPPGVSGIILALLVLLPEIGIAVKAARANQLQRSINASLGSALATLGLTIPALTVMMLVLQRPLVLGLEPKEQVLLGLTFAVSILSFGTGRTNILMGFVHLVLFAVFVVTAVLP